MIRWRNTLASAPTSLPQDFIVDKNFETIVDLSLPHASILPMLRRSVLLRRHASTLSFILDSYIEADYREVYAWSSWIRSEGNVCLDPLKIRKLCLIMIDGSMLLYRLA